MGSEQIGPNLVDRGKPGCKYHLVVVRNGIPLAVWLSAGRPGRHRKRPVKLYVDKAYDASTILASMALPTDRPVAEPGTDYG
jgi:hypothetical protein